MTNNVVIFKTRTRKLSICCSVTMSSDEAEQLAAEISRLRAFIGEQEAALDRAIESGDTMRIVRAYKALKESRAALFRVVAGLPQAEG